MKTILLAALALTICVHAQRTSADYAVQAGSTDAGGSRSASANYSCDSSLGHAAGISTDPASLEIVRTGYIGQLYEVTALAITADPPALEERDSRWLETWQVLDDSTLTKIHGSLVSWSVDSGPLSGINEYGIVTAASVYQNSPAVVRGAVFGLEDTLELTVLNVTADDYEEYAGDGIDDDWQVAYFGPPPNANAGPQVDVDQDGQDNRFEFLSGFSPVDPTARFILSIVSVDNDISLAQLKLNRVIPDRTYTLFASPDLSPASFDPIFTLPPVGSPEDDVIVQDWEALMPKRFYSISISKP